MSLLKGRARQSGAMFKAIGRREMGSLDDSEEYSLIDILVDKEIESEPKRGNYLSANVLSALEYYKTGQPAPSSELAVYIKYK